MLDRAALKATAKSNIQGCIGTYFLCMLVIGLISGMASLVIAGVILIPVFNFSITLITMKLVKREKFEVGDAFSGFSYFGKALWLFILMNFFTYLWSLLFVVPGIVKAYAYSMAPYILADNPNMTAREALNESKRITYGYKGDLFVLDLSFIGWDLLAGLTFGLLNIWLAPYKRATQGNFYLKLKEFGAQTAAVNVAQSANAWNNAAQDGTQSANAWNNAAQTGTQPAATTVLTQQKQATLTCLTGAYTGAHFPIPAQEELFIGKDAQLCSIVIEKERAAVSRKHMGISYNPWKNVYIVTDYSENGTWANDQQLPKGKPTEVAPGTILKLANDKTMFLTD